MNKIDKIYLENEEISEENDVVFKGVLDFEKVEVVLDLKESSNVYGEVVRIEQDYNKVGNEGFIVNVVSNVRMKDFV